MGIEGDDCHDGTNIILQRAVLGSPNQQFRTEVGSSTIDSLMCPGLSLSFSGGAECESNSTTIKLRSNTPGESGWQFNDDDSIESIECVSKVIDIDTNSKLRASLGESLILSNHTKDTFSMYQKWGKQIHNF